jgi:ribosomal protein S26
MKQALASLVLIASAMLAPAVELSTVGSNAAAQSDAEAIKQAALDYAESWYEGNPERMERALHPDLAKRIARTDPKTGRSRLDHMGALQLVQGVRAGYGKNTPKEKQLKNVVILDVVGNAATVKLEMSDWYDYLHVAKLGDRWVIVNVLWEMKPQPQAP